MSSKFRGRKIIPMGIPNLGQQQQIQINEADTTEKSCPCGCELFDMAYRIRVLPSISPKNPTLNDMVIKIEAFTCRECGLELGKEPVNAIKQRGDTP